MSELIQRIADLTEALSFDADRWADLAEILESGGTYSNARFFRGSEARLRQVIAGGKHHDDPTGSVFWQLTEESKPKAPSADDLVIAAVERWLTNHSPNRVQARLALVEIMDGPPLRKRGPAVPLHE